MGKKITKLELLGYSFVKDPPDPNCRFVGVAGIITEEDGMRQSTQALEDPTTQIGIAERQVAVVVDHVKGLERIVGDITRAAAVDMRKTAATLKGSLEKKRKALVEPQRRIVNFINEHFMPLREQLDGALETVDDELKRDRLEQERIARESREQAERIARIAQKKIDDNAAAASERTAAEVRKQALEAGYDEDDAEDLGVMEGQDAAGEIQRSAPPAPAIPPPAPAKTVATPDASVTFRKVWDLEVVDATLVPLRYQLVNEKQIRLDMREMVRRAGKPEPIAGIRFFQRTDVAGGR